jgi:GT2 family glycosyltransferase
MHEPGPGQLAAQRQSLGVVIPCRDNSWQLRGVLGALVAQTTRPDVVIVVDDNSSPPEQRRLQSLCAAFSAAYHRLPEPRSVSETLGRRSHARNAGTKRLKTDLVLYLDGDMLLGPRYVEEVKHCHARLGRVYVRGRRDSFSAALQRSGMENCLREVAKHETARLTTPVSYAIPPEGPALQRAYGDAYLDRWEWCASNNLSLKVKHAADVGYWDEAFLGWGEEDIDFSFRLHQSGLVPIYLASEGTIAHHLEHRVDRERNALTLRANARHLLNKFPHVVEQRRQAYACFGIDVDELVPGRSAGGALAGT